MGDYRPIKKFNDGACNPGFMLALELANYQLQTKKKAIKELTVNKEVQSLIEKHRYEVEDDFTSWMYGAFALALHRKHGFGAKRIVKLFEDLQDIKNDLIAQGLNSDQIWDIVRDEIGLDIDQGEKND